MRSKRLQLAIAALAALALCLAGFAGSRDAGKAPAPSLDLLKSLAGDWESVGADGKPDGKMTTSFKVTANGSAVVETLFGGTDREMVTVYHQDGDALVLTHYCVQGNQPKMKAKAAIADNQLVFDCVGLKSESDSHMHQGRITFIDDDHFRTQWFLYEDGENTYTADFNVQRRGR